VGAAAAGAGASGIWRTGASAPERLSGAAVAFVVGDPGQAHLAQPAEQVPGKLVLLLVPGRGRRGLLPDELPDGGEDLALVLGQAEVAVHDTSD
jgi:hypothetical protein